MAKKSKLITSFDDVSQWLTFGNIAIAGGKAALTGVEATVIRANDFAPVMPVIEYPAASGKYVGNPVQGTYNWDFPSQDFANLHSGRMEVVIPVAAVLTSNQQLWLFPRNSVFSYFAKYQMKFSQAGGYHLITKKLDNKFVIYNGRNYRLSGTNPEEWRWECINKYFMDTLFRHDADPNSYAFSHSIYDPRLAAPAAKGRLDTFTWTQGETHIYSSGEEYNTTLNPGILQLWPGVMGYCLPKNDENLYWEVTADWKAAYDAGTAELFLNVSAQNRTRHLFSGTLDGTRVETPPIVLSLGTNDAVYDFIDNIPFGSIITFPDRPDIYPRRVLGGLAATLWVIEDVPADVVVAGQRYDIWLPSECPLAASWPLNELTPIVYPLPYSDNLATINNFDGSVFAVGNKFVFGIYMNNYVNFQVVTECSELTLVENPAEDISVTTRPTFTSFTKNGIVGTAIVNDINPTDIVYAYAFSLTDIPQVLSVVGFRVGNGEIDLTLPDKPVCVFLVNYSDSGYSEPSIVVYPSILGKFDGVAPTITNVVEDTNSVEVTVSGTSGVLSVVYYTWEGNVSWHYGGEVLGSGDITISGLLPNKVYHFIALSKLSIE